MFFFWESLENGVKTIGKNNNPREISIQTNHDITLKNSNYLAETFNRMVRNATRMSLLRGLGPLISHLKNSNFSKDPNFKPSNVSIF